MYTVQFSLRENKKKPPFTRKHRTRGELLLSWMITYMHIRYIRYMTLHTVSHNTLKCDVLPAVRLLLGNLDPDGVCGPTYMYLRYLR